MRIAMVGAGYVGLDVQEVAREHLPARRHAERGFTYVSVGRG